MVSPSWLKNLKQLDLGEGAAGQHQQKPPRLAGSERVRSSPSQEDSGFTLLELLTVVLMIGILAAIAAPGWLGFVARQRVNTVQDVAKRAIQQAQLEAKTKKLSYSVSFKNEGQIPQVAIHPAFQSDGTTPFDTSLPDFKGWKNLSEGLDIKKGQILLCTNLAEKPNKVAATTCVPDDLKTKPRTITFDYTGTIAPDTDPNFDENNPLTITVANPVDYDAGKGNLKRCVKVMTLLGGMRTDSDGDCD